MKKIVLALGVVFVGFLVPHFTYASLLYQHTLYDSPESGYGCFSSNDCNFSSVRLTAPWFVELMVSSTIPVTLNSANLGLDDNPYTDFISPTSLCMVVGTTNFDPTCVGSLSGSVMPAGQYPIVFEFSYGGSVGLNNINQKIWNDSYSAGANKWAADTSGGGWDFAGCIGTTFADVVGCFAPPPVVNSVSLAYPTSSFTPNYSNWVVNVNLASVNTSISRVGVIFGDTSSTLLLNNSINLFGSYATTSLYFQVPISNFPLVDSSSSFVAQPYAVFGTSTVVGNQVLFGIDNSLAIDPISDLPVVRISGVDTSTYDLAAPFYHLNGMGIPSSNSTSTSAWDFALQCNNPVDFTFASVLTGSALAGFIPWMFCTAANIFIVPSTSSVSTFQSTFFSITTVPPFSLFMNMSQAVQSVITNQEQTTTDYSVLSFNQSTTFLGNNPIVLMTSSSLASFIGEPAKEMLFTDIRYGLWVILGALIALTVYYKVIGS